MAGPIRNAFKTGGEAVVKPVIEEAGRMIETGISSITGNPIKNQNPQSQLQNQQAMTQRSQQVNQLDQIKKQNILRFINQMKADEQRLTQQTAMEKQKKQAQEKQEEQKKIKEIQVEQKKKELPLSVKVGMTKRETKGGVGG